MKTSTRSATQTECAGGRDIGTVLHDRPLQQSTPPCLALSPLLAVLLCIFIPCAPMGCGIGKRGAAVPSARAYEGAARPPEQVAILWWKGYSVESIDGKPIPDNSCKGRDYCRIELLPGAHTFIIGPRGQQTVVVLVGEQPPPPKSATVQRDMQAGHFYTIGSANRDKSQMGSWSVVSEDILIEEAGDPETPVGGPETVGD